MKSQSGLLSEFYFGKRVFITGHTGFKGAWMSLWLRLMGAEVMGYALDPITTPNLFQLLDLKHEIGHQIGDIRDFERLKSTMINFQPDIVFHLAAQPIVRMSYNETRMTYETNVMGTVNILESTRFLPNTRVVINVTSDKCYENQEWDYAYRENDPLGGFDPYSSSKSCSEIVTAAYRHSFFTISDSPLIATARAGNVIGGGDWALDRIIPDIVRSLSINTPIVIRNPNAIRPWQHVLEPLSGYLWLAYRLWTGGHGFDEAWNFGPSSQSNLPVKKLVEYAIQAWGTGNWKEEESNVNPIYEAKYLKLDCSKTINLLNWEPVYDVQTSIERSVHWYKDFYHTSKDMKDRTIKDIENYIIEAKRKRISWAAEK